MNGTEHRPYTKLMGLELLQATQARYNVRNATLNFIAEICSPSCMYAKSMACGYCVIEEYLD